MQHHQGVSDRAGDENIDHIQQLLAEVVAGYIRRSPETIDPDVSFAEYGLDSVYALTVCADVEDRLNISIDPTIMWDYPTLGSLAEALATMVGEAPSTGSDSDNETGRLATTRGLDPAELLQEARLAEDLRPPVHAPRQAGPPYDGVLITGATGFAGAYLLRELLDRSSATVYALVRAKDDTEAQERVKLNLSAYGLWRDIDAARVVGLAGDLGQERFGLPEAAYAKLSDAVDVILHNGATVNFVLPYQRLRSANVGGTVEAIRLACTGRSKALHVVSSLGVMPERTGEQVVPEAPMADPEDVVGGYRQTKWVSEQLVVEAGRRGVPVGIYRPGNVTGSQVSGVGAADTIINALVKGCIQLGAAFELDVQLLLVPVDFLAKTIAGQVLSGAGVGRIVNLPGAKQLPWSGLISMVEELGYPVTMEPYPQWLERFADSGSSTALAPYRPLFPVGAPAVDLGVDGNRPTIITSVVDSDPATRGNCREVDLELLRKYLDHLVAIGYLDPPAWTRTESRDRLRGATAR